jgi:HK97 family phage major capsid protein
MTIVDQMAAIMEAVNQAGGVMTPEQSAEFDKLEAEHKAAEETKARKERLESIKASQAQSEGRKVKALPRVEHVSEGIERDPMQGFEDLGDFARAVAASCAEGGQIDDRLRIQGAPSSPAKGFADDTGYAVPAGMRDSIWAEVYGAKDDVVGLVDQEPTNSNAVELVKDESTPWGSTGVQAYWGAEGAQLTASQLDLSGELVRLHKVHAMVNASSEILEDGPRLARRLNVAAPAAIRYTIGDAIINGNGVGKPLGVLSAGSLVTVAKESGQAAATIVDDNITKMYSRLLASATNRAVWLVNQDVFSQLAALTLGDQPIWLPPNGLAGGPLGTLLGRPVYSIEQCATLGTVGDIILMDPSGYYMPVKAGGTRFDSSMHLYFDYDVMSFRWTFRCGGRPYLSNTISPAKGSATRSQIIALATRA